MSGGKKEQKIRPERGGDGSVVKVEDLDVLLCLVVDFGPIDEHDGMAVSCADSVMAVVGHPCIDCEDVGFDQINR